MVVDSSGLTDDNVNAVSTPRRRATYSRPHGVRHLFAAHDLAKGKLYGHIKKVKNRSKFLEFCRYLRTLYPTATLTTSAHEPWSAGQTSPDTA